MGRFMTKPGRCTSNSSALLVEPVWRFTDQHGLMVAHSIIDVAATHTTVQVLNSGFAPITVYKEGSSKMSLLWMTVTWVVPDRHLIKSTQGIHNQSASRRGGYPFISNRKYEGYLMTCFPKIRMVWVQYSPKTWMGFERVVAYASRALSRTEMKYCAMRSSLLLWLHNFKEPEGQVARWLDCYRNMITPLYTAKEEANSCDAVSHLMLPTWTEEEIKSFQSADPNIHQMVYWLESDATPRGCASSRLVSLWVQRKSPSHKARAPMEISQTLAATHAEGCYGHRWPAPRNPQRFGVPDSLHAGQGRNFKAKVLKEVCQLLGVKKTRTTPYHPPRRWTTCSRKLVFLHRPRQGPFKVVKVLGPSIYRIVDCANARRCKVVHFNQMKPAPSHSTAEEDDEYYDVIVHSVPPVGIDRQATILEVPRQHQLEHPVPEIEQPAVVRRVPPPAVEGAPALRRSTRISRPPVRYGDPVVLWILLKSLNENWSGGPLLEEREQCSGITCIK
eukprot:Em0002g707a